jgi:hypothetical protein
MLRGSDKTITSSFGKVTLWVSALVSILVEVDGSEEEEEEEYDDDDDDDDDENTSKSFLLAACGCRNVNGKPLNFNWANNPVFLANRACSLVV